MVGQAHVRLAKSRQQRVAAPEPALSDLQRSGETQSVEPEKSWADLEAQFRELQAEDTHGLIANWTSGTWTDTGEQWYLSGAQNKRLEARFEWTAERAALKLGHPGGPDAVYYWLDLLKGHSPNFRGGIQNTTYENGIETHNENGEIHRVCEASADYCLKLANDGIARGRSLSELPLRPDQPELKEGSSLGKRREAFVNPILRNKGWSVHDWASQSVVDFHTASDYLKGRTNPYPSTRAKLARSLGIEVQKLPQ